MSIIKKIIIIIINLVVIIITKCIPRNPKIWIFGGWFGQTFSDNSKYLFLYCHNNKEKLNLDKVIWITGCDRIYKELNKNNFDVIKKNSMKSIWYHIRSEYHVICQSTEDINSYLSANATRIQLWHGVGLKRLVNSENVNHYSWKYRFKYLTRLITSKGLWYKYKFLSVSNFATNNLYKYGFRLWENDTVNSNYPRNMYLLNKENCKSYMNSTNENEIELISLIKALKLNHKVILYAPTYRGCASREDIYINKYPFNIKNQVEFEEFTYFLKKNNLYIINKCHFAGKYSSIETVNNIINVPKFIDLYHILNYMDLLITDYSSIYSDFLLIDKPIIFYIYDFLEYKNKDKGFLLDFDTFTPGDKIKSVEKLKSSILDNLNHDKYRLQRDNIKHILFGESLSDDFYDLINKIKYN